jgi:hypothetical protein
VSNINTTKARAAARENLEGVMKFFLTILDAKAFDWLSGY